MKKQVAVKDLRPGDHVDLEGDAIADPNRENSMLADRFMVVESLETETAGCVCVYFEDFNCAFPPDHLVNAEVLERPKLEAHQGYSLRVNAPHFFKDVKFIAWLGNNTPKFTWHIAGDTPGEWSDVVVLVDPSFSGEGCASDMPAHIWDQIVQVCRDELGSFPASKEHIAVRLTNLEE